MLLLGVLDSTEDDPTVAALDFSDYAEVPEDGPLDKTVPRLGLQHDKTCGCPKTAGTNHDEPPSILYDWLYQLGRSGERVLDCIQFGPAIHRRSRKRGDAWKAVVAQRLTLRGRNDDLALIGPAEYPCEYDKLVFVSGEVSGELSLYVSVEATHMLDTVRLPESPEEAVRVELVEATRLEPRLLRGRRMAAAMCGQPTGNE
jgi:hypothetical protein